MLYFDVVPNTYNLCTITAMFTKKETLFSAWMTRSYGYTGKLICCLPRWCTRGTDNTRSHLPTWMVGAGDLTMCMDTDAWGPPDLYTSLSARGLKCGESLSRSEDRLRSSDLLLCRDEGSVMNLSLILEWEDLEWEDFEEECFGDVLGLLVEKLDFSFLNVGASSLLSLGIWKVLSSLGETISSNSFPPDSPFFSLFPGSECLLGVLIVSFSLGFRA